jgi:pyruvate formate-lyase activating enzyme-like uncharacterized protein
LVRWWGDVPLVLDPTEQANETLKVSRSSTADVYKQIYADIDAHFHICQQQIKEKLQKMQRWH